MFQRPSRALFFAGSQGGKAAKGAAMDTKIAMISIIIEDKASVEKMNAILHEYSSYIIGRMGIPYRDANVNLISVSIDAPLDVINALSGKLGRLAGVSTKTAYSNVKGRG